MIAAAVPVLTQYQALGLDPLPARSVGLDVAKAGIDFDQVALRYPTLEGVMRAYLHEHAIPSTRDARRAAQAAWEWLDALNPLMDATKLTRAHGRIVIEALQQRGLKPGSVKRIMGVGIAALNHARKEGVLKEVPKFPKVSGGSPRVRWLSREEHRRLMQQPMSKRLHDFYVLAFATGARSEAIEQLTPRRVDFATRTIDYRLVGVDHKNKRRAVVPISDSLLPRLQRMCAGKGLDEPVIGYGKHGRITTTYHESKRVLRGMGIDEFGVARHVARHTVASWMLQGDPDRGIPPAPIHQVAQLLGDTVMMIERTYGHVQPRHLMDATRILP